MPGMCIQYTGMNTHIRGLRGQSSYEDLFNIYDPVFMYEY
jgi:hypothetical protein